MGKEVFRVQNLTRRGVFHSISFHVKAGEIVGIAGLVGAGRTEVLRALFGLDPYDSGEILVNGRSVRVRTPVDSIANGVIMLSEDRRRYGIVPVRSVKENVTITRLEEFIYNGRWHRQKEIDRVSELCQRMNVKTPSINTDISALSGGNQQKVVLAKWMVRDPLVFLLDEPTRGIDVGAKHEIYKLMTTLARKVRAL